MAPPKFVKQHWKSTRLKDCDWWCHRNSSSIIEKVLGWKIVIGGATKIRQATLEKVRGWDIVIGGANEIHQATLKNNTRLRDCDRWRNRNSSSIIENSARLNHVGRWCHRNVCHRLATPQATKKINGISLFGASFACGFCRHSQHCKKLHQKEQSTMYKIWPNTPLHHVQQLHLPNEFVRGMMCGARWSMSHHRNG